MRLRKWHADIASPWLTRAEAADYLRWSMQTVDRYLVPMGPGNTPGKMRYELQEVGKIKKIRILAADVYAICPLPQDIAV